MKALTVAVAFLFLSPLFAAGTKHARVETPKDLTAKVGETISVPVTVLVDKGFHIQANPPATPQLIATYLEVEKKEGVEIGIPEYPAGKKYRLKNSPSDISTYDGKVEIKLPVTVNKPGKVLLKAKLRYQACDDTTCFFPLWENFELRLTVLSKKH